MAGAARPDASPLWGYLLLPVGSPTEARRATRGDLLKGKCISSIWLTRVDKITDFKISTNDARALLQTAPPPRASTTRCVPTSNPRPSRRSPSGAI